MNPTAYISHSTVRLVCQNEDEESVGTAFLYQFDVDVAGIGGSRQNLNVAALVTNKHVVADMDTMEFTLTFCPDAADIDEHVDGETHCRFRVEQLQRFVVPHPEDEVDVCIVPIAPHIQVPDGMKLRHSVLSQAFHLPEKEMEYTRAIEPVVMVGYPNGLWDEVNNRPISRTGLTASHPLRRWNGYRQFVIDAACFIGSSGSPVFLYEDGMFRTGGANYSPGTRVRLLGVLFAGPMMTQEGRLETVAIPTSTRSVPVIEGMLNLGFVAHADVLDEFVPLLRACIRSGTPSPVRLSHGAMSWADRNSGTPRQFPVGVAVTLGTFKL
jgi:V8-like Glu-specific endopeptidase